ncbi:hypothetical protein TNCV_3644421 [Trichonephila clavipes]|nr:hypothetical protein TNCV_3644421 [Trichonephila clavipes]
MALGDSLPQINLGVQGETQGGLHTPKTRSVEELMLVKSVACLLVLPWVCSASIERLRVQSVGVHRLLLWEELYSKQHVSQFPPLCMPLVLRSKSFRLSYTVDNITE